MPYELKNAKITHISLVDKGANGVPFAIIKEHGAQAIQKSITIAKSDGARQIVYGVVYAPNVVDAHGDMMTAEEIEKAAHGFMEAQHTHNIDKQHDLQADKGFVIESYIAPCDMQLGNQTIVKGSWVVGVKVTDSETWAQIEKGEITGFSMWGVGQRVPVEAAPSTSQEDIMKGFFHAISKFFRREGSKPVTISKAVQSFKSRMETGDVRDQWFNARWALDDTLWEIMNDDTITDKAAAVGQTIDEFKTVAVALAAKWPAEADVIGKAEKMELISKAGKAISSGNMKHIEDAIAALTTLKEKVTVKESEGDDDVKVEDIQKAVEVAVAPLAKQVANLTGEVALIKGEQPNNEPQGASEQARLTDTITKALEPIQKQVEQLADDVQVLKNSRGSSAQPVVNGMIEKSDVPSYVRLMNGGQ
ncbi:XkdF-like putative serine protease domain-containing protein [Aneurinibacillus thermoaerophilus]|uniref:XkdF-like putative serine protease domain-containing protein n=1 Tax=Aneurinibacillus thermoaerophilus TaxID=143495 RepID=UPI002E1D12F3|nr:XkdF-like putative serine protease domain-containing protein [Aneurinibacillus thermoaerophilus]